MGIASLILSVLFIPAAVAVILGFIALGDIKKSKGRLLGKGAAITGIVAGILSFVIAILISQSGGSRGEAKQVDPEVDLTRAELNVSVPRGFSGFSNVQEGVAIAERVSEMMKEMALAATDTIKERHDFATHCQLHDDSVAIIVFVPKLRKFNDESKEIFCDLAWASASAALVEAKIAPGTKLAVGVRGSVLYENIYFGEVSADAAGAPARTVKDRDALEAFFKETLAAPASPAE